MSRASTLLEKFAKPVYDDKPHVETLAEILANVKSAVEDLEAAGNSIEKKSDMVAFNRCLQGMRGTSMKVASIAAQAKKDAQR